MTHPEGGFRDVVGILESETTLRKRDGALVELDPKEIVVWRQVEEITQSAGRGAPLSLRIREMEMAAAATWPAVFQENLGEWILRASGKYTMRANSVLVLGDPGVPLPDALERVINFYQSHGLPPILHIPLPTYQDFDDYCDREGWEKRTDVHVMVTDIGSPSSADHPDFHWDIRETFDEEWLALQGDEGIAEIMKRAPAHYASLRIKGELIAVGRAANFHDWTTLTRLFVRPDSRGKGIGRELVNRLLIAAKDAGTKKALLQVDMKNKSAIRLYESLGFRLHHTYCYRVFNSIKKESIADSGGC
jgi:GNAT superfamily N-acetyltransferase